MIEPIEAIAMDVDGTLAGPGHRVSQRTIRAVRQLTSCGLRAILVTGRTEQSTVALAQTLQIATPVIAANGAVITDPHSGTRLRLTLMSSGEVHTACSAAQRLDLQPFVFTPDTPWTDRSGNLTTLLEAVLDQDVAIGSLTEPAIATSAIKIMIGGHPQRLDELSSDLRSKVPRLQRSMPEFFESAPAGASKKESLASLLDHLGIDPRHCIGIGDGDNDADWLASIGWPVAVANARTSIRSMASQVIGSNTHDGVAEYLEVLCASQQTNLTRLRRESRQS